MLELTCTIPTPKTSQELELAIQQYRANELDGLDLFCQWQAIRDAALEQSALEAENDCVPGADSY